MIQHENVNESFLDSYITEFYILKEKFPLETYITQREEDITGDELLQRLLQDDPETSVADFEYKKRRIDLDEYPSLYTPAIKSKIIHFFAKRYPHCSIVRSGHWFYPAGEGMRWHTNADTPYTRCYLNFSANGDSYFKYYDQELQKTIISQDNSGWNLRTFEIGESGKNLFWHSVYSNTDRVSLGFRIINNLK